MGASGFSGQSTIDSPDCWYLREKECYVVFFFGRGGGVRNFVWLDWDSRPVAVLVDMSG